MSDPQAQPESPAACATCRVPIADAYYTRGAETLCERCSHLARDAGPPGSPPTRMLGALGLGLVAALMAGGLWLLVADLTGYEFGIIAILVGLVVGAAVQIGSRRVGGVPYQLLAVGLTYSAIVMTYVPGIVTELTANEEFSAQVEAAHAEALAEAGIPPGETRPADAPASASRAGDEPFRDLSAEEIASLTAVFLAVPIAYAAPFLMGFQNAIGILIIGIAVWQAWMMNAREISELKGPFRRGDAPPA